MDLDLSICVPVKTFRINLIKSMFYGTCLQSEFNRSKLTAAVRRLVSETMDALRLQRLNMPPSAPPWRPGVVPEDSMWTLGQTRGGRGQRVEEE